jgi:hypothetical protein
MIAIDTLTIRRYRTSDYIGDLVPEFAHLELDPECVWVAESEGEIAGVMLITYGNQTAMILRLVAAQDAPPTWVAQLLRYAVADLEGRGCVMLISCLSVDTPQELKLHRIFMRAGGYSKPFTGHCVGIAIEHARKW